MATEKNDMHEFLAESDKLIKASELSLKKMEKVRGNIGLQAGASKEFLEHIPTSSEKHEQAQQELKKFVDGMEIDEQDSNTETDKKKKRKRSKLAKAMNRKLRI